MDECPYCKSAIFYVVVEKDKNGFLIGSFRECAKCGKKWKVEKAKHGFTERAKSARPDSKELPEVRTTRDQNRSR